MDRLKSWLITVIVLVAIAFLINPDLIDDLGFKPNDSDRIARAYQTNQSNIMVEAEGRVTLLFPEVEDTPRLQKFYVVLENNHRLLIAHNIDIAPPVPVALSSTVRFRGEYDWSAEGGTVHWTHADPNGIREGGWIEYQGRRYD